ncbi:hypothetical protein [Defluviitalea phaphyphila]|uniref:hypothetical protein n=1 Tax=Defluviitalea phaphyphila TaxID=1473580 RepID=UPI0007304503|nr:hypothetical protein [Defluviitalea phaphyphila]
MQREVESCSKRIASEELNLKGIENIFQREIDNLNSWWEGLASKQFLREYKGVNYDINRIHSSIKKLEYRLKRLVYQIERAEEERERKERLEKMKKAK